MINGNSKHQKETRIIAKEVVLTQAGHCDSCENCETPHVFSCVGPTQKLGSHMLLVLMCPVSGFLSAWWLRFQRHILLEHSCSGVSSRRFLMHGAGMVEGSAGKSFLLNLQIRVWLS